jgi:RimJ/RimL family protein N-acetyltransferase
MIVNVTGKLVALGPLHRELVPVIHRWLNDLELQLRQGGHVPMVLEQVTAWYESKAQNDQEVFFVVYEVQDARPIGVSGLRMINYRNRTALFVIWIGEPDARGRGYGTEATRLTLDYAFTVLRLQNVMLSVYAFNVPAVRAYEKAGFREFGRRRQSYCVGGRVWDEIYMDSLATEFVSPVLENMVIPRNSRGGGGQTHDSSGPAGSTPSGAAVLRK